MTARPLLSPAGWLYGRITEVRNFLYDRNVFRAADLGKRTISIGNITAGGTGKTPVVAKVAEMLLDEGEKVCILTRGYGRAEPRNRVLVSDGNSILADAVSAGDEPFEIAEKLSGKAVIVADAARTAAAKWALEQCDVSVFLLDDGFQHRQVKRDLDVVLIDLTDPFGSGMLPAGELREPLRNLRRVDAFILTRCDLAKSERETTRVIREHNMIAPIFTSHNSVKRIRRMNGDECGSPSDPVFAFCGIGNPDNFLATLENTGITIAAARRYRDHHRYTKRDIDSLIEEAAANDAKGLITTHKDSVKLAGLLPEDLPVYIVEIEPIIEPLDDLRDLIFRKF